MLKVVIGLIALFLCLMASYKEFQGKRNYLVMTAELALGAVLAAMVMA